MKRLSNLYNTSTIGNLIPYQESQPITVLVENIKFIPIFTCIEKLESCMNFLNIKDYTIKEIKNSIDFLNSTIPHYRIARDLHIVNGNTRFTEILSEN